MPIDIESDISGCLELVFFRVRQLHYALADEAVGLPNAMAEMALYDLEEAVGELRLECDKQFHPASEERRLDA